MVKKAYVVGTDNFEEATLVFAESREKARYDGACTLWRAYMEVKAIRLPEADRYVDQKITDKMLYELDFAFDVDSFISKEDAEEYGYTVVFDEEDNLVGKKEQ